MPKKEFKIIWLSVALITAVIVYWFLASLPQGIIKNEIVDKTFRGLAWFRFDNAEELKSWEEKIFKGKVLYSVKVKKREGYLNASSNNAASGMLYWIKFSPKKQPYISWKWKITKFPEKKEGQGQVDGWIERDDYAARFYVIFPRFPFFRVQCLEYVWDKDLPVGTVITNPSFTNLKILVIETGERNSGKWIAVERNIYDDFKKVFGVNPPKVGAIAVMTDSDNTASTAEAQYDEIKVGYEK